MLQELNRRGPKERKIRKELTYYLRNPFQPVSTGISGENDESGRIVITSPEPTLRVDPL
jgi:hypothetical protein